MAISGDWRISFKKEVTAFQEAEDCLATVNAGHVDLHRSRSNEVQRLYGVVTLKHHGFVAVEILGYHQIGKHPELFFVQFREELHALQQSYDVSVHILIPSCLLFL